MLCIILAQHYNFYTSAIARAIKNKLDRKKPLFSHYIMRHFSSAIKFSINCESLPPSIIFPQALILSPKTCLQTFPRFLLLYNKLPKAAKSFWRASPSLTCIIIFEIDEKSCSESSLFIASD